MSTSRIAIAMIAAITLFAVGCADDSSEPVTDASTTTEVGTIQGTITALADGAVLEGATVTTDPATVSVTTGADGAYLLADVEPGTYELLIEMEGYLPKSREGVVVVADQTVTVDVALEAEDVTPVTTGGIEGTVTDAAGAPVVGANVATDPATVTAVTGDDGTYALAEIEAGTYSVVVTAAGFESLTLTGIAVVAGETTTADATLVSEPVLGSARVAVTDACRAEALADATVKMGDDSLTTDASGEIVVADLEPGEYTFDVTADGFLPGTATVTVSAAGEVTADIDLECQSRAIAEMAREFLATVGPDFSVVQPSQGLFDNLNDGNDGNDPVVISVRSAEHYAIGHVPGAINIPWKTVATDEALALLGEPFTTTKHSVYCYTGHTGGIATGVLNLLGYTAQNMKFGIMSWTKDEAVRAIAPYSEETDAHEFATETTINEPTAEYDPPVLAFEGVTSAWEATKAAAQAYLSREGMAATMPAQALFDVLNDGDTSNDPFILSVRSAEHYALGHIPGAVNVPYTKVALEENLRKLPTDRKIVVYCYTGHTGAVATAVLGTLGYDAVNLKFGIGSWTKDAAVRAVPSYVEETDAHDFPFNTGANP